MTLVGRFILFLPLRIRGANDGVRGLFTRVRTILFVKLFRDRHRLRAGHEFKDAIRGDDDARVLGSAFKSYSHISDVAETPKPFATVSPIERVNAHPGNRHPSMKTRGGSWQYSSSEPGSPSPKSSSPPSRPKPCQWWRTSWHFPLPLHPHPLVRAETRLIAR